MCRKDIAFNEKNVFLFNNVSKIGTGPPVQPMHFILMAYRNNNGMLFFNIKSLSFSYFSFQCNESKNVILFPM